LLFANVAFNDPLQNQVTLKDSHVLPNPRRDLIEKCLFVDRNWILRFIQSSSFGIHDVMLVPFNRIPIPSLNLFPSLKPHP